MNRTLFPAVVIVFLSFCGYAEEKEPLCIKGDTWYYEVKGTESSPLGTKKADGIEMRKTEGMVEIEGETMWLLTTQKEKETERHYMDNQGMLKFIEFVKPDKTDSYTMQPPLPEISTLKLQIGESREFDTQMVPKISSPSDPTSNMHLKITYLGDETVTVPAGTYEHCPHYLENDTVTIGKDDKWVKIISKTDIWYSDQVRGSVKEITQTEPVMVGETAIGEKASKTSVLRRFTPGRK